MTGLAFVCAAADKGKRRPGTAAIRENGLK